MKYTLRILPTILLILFVLAIAAHGKQTVAAAGMERGPEVQAPRQESERSSAMLDATAVLSLAAVFVLSLLYTQVSDT